MDLKHFGDSYDIVKKVLLQGLAPFGPWGVHPMFTHEVSETEVAKFSRLLGTPVLSTRGLGLETNRDEYLRCAATAGASSWTQTPGSGFIVANATGRRSSFSRTNFELLPVPDPTGW